MTVANPHQYLNGLVEELKKHWPGNRTVNLVCHGHSVPSGYFATPRVDTFHAYPHLLLRMLGDRFPYAVMNVIVTAIGGEHSEQGAARLQRDVLCHRPDVLMIDYSLNDLRIGLGKAEHAWRTMIEQALGEGIKLILLTPTWDSSCLHKETSDRWNQLVAHAEQVRFLAKEYEIGLADSFAAFEQYIHSSGSISDLLSWSNHPNAKGHQIVADMLARWFAYS